MRKVLFVPSPTLPFPPVNGGAVQNLLNFLVESNEMNKNYNIEITSIFDSEAKKISDRYLSCKVHYINIPNLLVQLRDKQIRYLSGRFSSFIEYVYLNGIKKILTSNKYDIVIFENTHKYAYLLRDYLKNTYKLLHLHNDYLNSQIRNAELYTNSFDEIICISKYIQKQVLSIGNNTKTEVVYNGIDTSKFQKNTRARSTIRSQLKIDDNTKVVLFSGRLVKEKGVLELVKAFSKVDEKLNTALLIIGSKTYGTTIKDKYLKDLEKMVSSSKMRIMFTGYVNYNEIADYYSVCDIGVMPTTLYEEALSLSVIEYMSMGMPVLISNSGGMVELVDPDCGFVIERNEEFISNLTARMEMLIRDENKFKLYSEEASIRANQFDKKIYCESMWNVIKRRL